MGDIDPSAIASAEAFGTGSVGGAIGASAIASAEAFGDEHASGPTEIVVYVAGVDVTNKLLRQGFGVTDSLGNIKGLTCIFKEGSGASAGDELIILDRRTDMRIFGGYIKEVTQKFIKADTYLDDCSVQDWTRKIDDVQSGVNESYTSQTEKAILTALFAAYAPTITVGADVITGSTVTKQFADKSLRAAIQELADDNGRTWYVDFNEQLHYFTDGGEAADFGLSDSPDGATTHKYTGLEYCNDVVGSEQRGQLVCWEPGLAAGQTLSITNAKLAWAAQSFTIYEVSARLLASQGQEQSIFLEYTVSFGARPKRLSERVITPEITVPEIPENIKSSQIVVDFDGGGAVVAAGSQYFLRIMFACELVSWTLLAPPGELAAAMIDVWKDTWANFAPTNADSITNGDEPVIASDHNTDTLENWSTTTITKGDVLGFNVDANDIATRLTLILEFRKT